MAKFDRLSRDDATLIVLERRLQRYGVELYSAAEENGDGPVAEFMRGQLALVAQLERATILERVGAGKAKKKLLGRHVHGRKAGVTRARSKVGKRSFKQPSIESEEGVSSTDLLRHSRSVQRRGRTSV